MNFENPKSNTYLCSHSGILYIYYNKEIFMAYPTYNSVVDIPTNADTEGRWKGFMILDGESAKNVKIRTLHGEDVTFEDVIANTVYPIAFNKCYNSGTTVGNGKLVGLN